MSEHDAIACFHEYIDGITFKAVVTALKRSGRHRDGVNYVYKNRVYDEFPWDVRTRLGATVWLEVIRQSLKRLMRDRFVNDVSKAVNHEGSIALANPLEAMVESANG